MKPAMAVAQKFLNLARIDRSTLTPMEVNKLTYIAHGWMLGLYSRALIKEEVEAWKYGPVIPKLYHALKKYGSKPVTDRIHNFPDEFDYMEQDLIKQVYEKYGRLGGIALSSLTHQTGTPWHHTWDGTYARVISDNAIEHYYKSLAGGEGAN